MAFGFFGRPQPDATRPSVMARIFGGIKDTGGSLFSSVAHPIDTVGGVVGGLLRPLLLPILLLTLLVIALTVFIGRVQKVAGGA